MFITEDFMLTNDISKNIYHKYAKDKPIYDYHCHLSAKDIFEDKKFNNITEIWLLHDHYKWRVMRANGVSEEYITGSSNDFEKFKYFSKTIDNCIGNPIYHWSALELKRYFNIDDILGKDNYEKIYEKVNKYILENNISPRNLIKQSNVELICTTDSPIDDLSWHIKLKEDKAFKTKVIPGFRPDEVFYENKEKFLDFISKLSNVSKKDISSYKDLIEALENRINYFSSLESNISDHGIKDIYFEEYTKEEVEKIFKKVLNKEKITKLEHEKYVTSILVDLASIYSKKNWVMQIHFGAIRNNNSKMYEKIGPDTGFDSIKDNTNIAYKLNGLLNLMKKNNGMPKLIIYNLDSNLNKIIATTIANFQENFGKLQFGAAWWFNDTKYGILEHIKCLSEQGTLGNFIGMLTDSRSYLSYTRHEYFRRIFCEYIGKLVVKGEIPNDDKILKKLIENISYYNAKRYFEEE